MFIYFAAITASRGPNRQAIGDLGTSISARQGEWLCGGGVVRQPVAAATFVATRRGRASWAIFLDCHIDAPEFNRWSFDGCHAGGRGEATPGPHQCSANTIAAQAMRSSSNSECIAKTRTKKLMFLAQRARCQNYNISPGCFVSRRVSFGERSYCILIIARAHIGHMRALCLSSLLLMFEVTMAIVMIPFQL